MSKHKWGIAMNRVGTQNRSESTGAGNRKPVDIDAAWQKIHPLLRIKLGEDVYTSWFASMALDDVNGDAARVTVPVKFLQTWIQSHYSDELLSSIQSQFKAVSRVEIALRQPGAYQQKPKDVITGANAGQIAGGAGSVQGGAWPNGFGAGQPLVRTEANGFEGSPLDPRYTFDSFVVGASNRMPHAAAVQTAETILVEQPRFNPLVIHSSVGLGKTHLLHAIAWDVKRRAPHAQVLYLTAERFRFQFVEALKSQKAMAFKDMFHGIDLLLVDDLEFLQGERTELEFDHIINAMLDGGRQLVVASARPPSQLSRLNERMRSRLQGGLVSEIEALDYDLRLKILERRIAEKRAADPSFEIPRDVVEFLAERLRESGRELEGAVTRLYATSRYMSVPISAQTAEAMIRDLVHGAEPKRIKIEDILRVISRRFGVSRSDLLSERRHRAIVWPRQIGMYLAKQLTARSLPEIGRRFGGRDHTTVLHAIRKIDGQLKEKAGLKDEIEELTRLLNS